MGFFYRSGSCSIAFFLLRDDFQDLGTAYLVEYAAVAEVREFFRALVSGKLSAVYLILNILHELGRDHVVPAHGGDGESVLVRKAALVAPHAEGIVDRVWGDSCFLTGGQHFGKDSRDDYGHTHVFGFYVLKEAHYLIPVGENTSYS